jgi:1-aminocyclopropane-1-carboxylate deaminase/D-cysteine desulfhydrase-like pyridoxal-dependent ACC family enzyme
MSLEREQQLEAALAQLSRVPLVSVRPTPLEALDRLSEELGGPTVFIKRDDLTGLAFGGNKTRMLEFSLADAKAKGAEVIVTGAAVQSNYCRQMAAACAKLGLELHLVLRPHRELDKTAVQGNHFLQRLFGAKVTLMPDFDMGRHQEALRAKVDQLQAQGRKVYWPRQADTVDLDAIAYAETALEIVRQCRDRGIYPEYLYSAALDTTQAGLVLGFAYVRSPIQVRGFSPFENATGRIENMVRMANQAAARLGLNVTFGERDFANDDRWVGERYGIPSKEGLAAIHLLARREGLLLDPVYTSKAMAALIADIRTGRLDRNVPVLFLHTGGTPALFGYVDEVMGAEPA